MKIIHYSTENVNLQQDLIKKCIFRHYESVYIKLKVTSHFLLLNLKLDC